MELLLFCLPCLLTISSLYLLRLLAGSRRRNLPPGPRALPLIGNLLDLGATPHRSLARLADRHGPVMALRLGVVTTVVASSAEAARDVLHRHDAAFSWRSVPDAARARDHDKHSMGWLPPSSARWRALRKVCSAELFAPHRLDARQSLRHEKARQLVAHVARLAGRGEAVDVGRVAFTTVLNLLSCTIFSVDLASFDERGATWEFRDVITEFTVAVGVPNVCDFFPVFAPLDPQRLRRRVAEVFERLHAMFEEQTERRMGERHAGEPPKNDFLDVLLDYRGAEDGQALDRQTLLSLLTVTFFAVASSSILYGQLENNTAVKSDCSSVNYFVYVFIKISHHVLCIFSFSGSVQCRERYNRSNGRMGNGRAATEPIIIGEGS